MRSPIHRIAVCIAVFALAATCLAGCTTSSPTRPTDYDVIRFEVSDRILSEDLLAFLEKKDAPVATTYYVSLGHVDDIDDADIQRILEEEDGVISSSEDLEKVLDFFSDGGYSIEVVIEKASDEQQDDGESSVEYTQESEVEFVPDIQPQVEEQQAEQ